MLIGQKITLLGLLCPLAIIVGIGYAIYYYRTDVTGMGIGFIIVSLFVGAGVFIVDRLAVRYIQPGWLSVGEGLLLAVSLLGYAYNTRTTTLDFSANRSQYFVVLWTKTPTTPRPAGLFNKTLTVPEGHVTRLNRTEFERLNVKPPTSWANGYSSRGIELNDSRLVSGYFYAPPDHLYTEAQIADLIRKAAEQQSNQGR